jgi:enoyl-[acyl-carrier protein] reductase II
MKSSRTLENLWKKGKEFLGTDYAIMGGAMTWVSNHQLVSAISNAGGFGVLACGSMPPNLLAQEIEKTFNSTNKPFGVNLITMHPDLEELIHVCGKSGIKHVVLAGGLPTSASITLLKSYNLKVLGFAPAYIIARKLIRMGVDALVIEGHEAGGHIGPVSTSVLAQEILPLVTEVPVFVAGGIGRGEAIVSYLQMGASGCQLGTRFVCANESPVHPKFKEAFIHAQARDAVPSVQFDSRLPVIPVRAITNKASERFMDFQREMVNKVEAGEIEIKEAQLQVEHFWAGALRRAAVEGDIENGSLMAGQSVGMVTKQESLQEIMDDLVGQAIAFLERSAPHAA